LKPTSTVSETKFTIEPPSNSQTTSAKSDPRSAVQAARAAKRAGSKLPMSPSVAPIRSEMAEVTVIAVCLELQNSQRRVPRRGRRRSGLRRSCASDASAIPAGRR
jgi:hypothetical protein